MEGFLFQSLFICMEKNTIKDAYSKLINSNIIKKVYPMVDHIDIVEFKKLPNLSTIYDLSVNIFVDDIDMTVENMYDSNFDPHWLTDHYLKNIAKYTIYVCPPKKIYTITLVVRQQRPQKHILKSYITYQREI